ncbi:LuxR C-terminal-related transcriptional regulator [Mycobacterium sp. ITM-2016-00317]|uniref:response regulator transcription factor n=1 Tax=Mycobacterium sp. ITM-2016-00317 TaxID=2099694 RepID=UPI00287F885F|nr:LuxR C-terminal-related transcriptional regulator [Mycobacterium sp. ITM-2016-00317]WNG88142.1 LuxR C-terminal-related transcriptional regulator [Mycobacterium sp. ITM-2016-00317]
MEASNERAADNRRRAIRVAVVDENHIFRRGVRACLETSSDILIVFEGPTGPVPEGVDVVIASDRAATDIASEWPTLVCSDASGTCESATTAGNVVAVLPRGHLTESQLGAAVHAAASGLRVVAAGAGASTVRGGLPERSLKVLRLLAAGYGTREISDTVGCSERTVKYAIRDAERHLEARSRAQVVAEAIRHGMI